MVNASFSFRILAAFILLTVVALVCASLGRWQLGRAAEREAIHARIMAGRQATPITLGPDASESDLQDWRAAQVTGQWLNRYTVLLANRNLEGRPGYWVATPLALSVSTHSPTSNTPSAALTLATIADSDRAILVLRGWIPRPLGANATLPPLSAPTGLQTLRGELREHVPRLFDLGTLGGTTDTGLPADPAAGQVPLEVQNIDLENFAAVTGIKLLPAVLQQTSAAALEDGTPLIQNWPTPSLDADKNRGYAVQWFAFAAIAAGAWLVLAWRTLRRRSSRGITALRKE